MFHYAEWEWKVLLLYHALCTVLFSHQWMRRHLTALHSTLHQHSLSSCYWLDSGLSVGGHVFWRRRGFGEWFAGRMGSYAFNASLLLLASQKRLSYSLLKLQNPPGFQTHFFDSKLPWQFFIILQTLYIQLWAGANRLFALKLYCQDLLKDARWRISNEKAWTELFVCVNLLNTHL